VFGLIINKFYNPADLFEGNLMIHEPRMNAMNALRRKQSDCGRQSRTFFFSTL